MEDVKINGISFNTAVLKTCESLKDAQQRFKQHDKDVVKQAYDQAKKMKAEK
jgi:hypothetical protein